MNRHMRACVFRYVGFGALLGALLLPVLPAQIVRAAAVSVTIQTDSVGACATSGTGTCSLRDAVLYANAHAGTQITVPAGTYTLTIVPTGPNDANSGDLNLTADVTITGAGAASTIIQASATDSSAGIDRVFRVDGGAATISGVTVRNGKPSDGGNGGGIYVPGGGALTLNDVTVSGNAGTAYGGGIWADNTLSITNSIISGNTTTGNAGGVGQGGSTLTLANSTVSNNTAASNGGGVAFYNASAGVITQSTINANHANGVDGGGIAILTGGTVTVTNTTIAGNTADGRSGGGVGIFSGTGTFVNTTIAGNDAIVGGGIRVESGTINFRNTIIAGNTSQFADDGFGSIVSQGYNLVGSTFNFNGFGGTDLANVNPQLGPLQYSGGPTQTMAPPLNSPAVDAIPPANCAVTTDQGGTPRPQGSKCDIGAVEILVPTLALNNASGAPGASVTFSGSDFRTGLTLMIGGTAATIGTVAADGNSFTATVPSPHASGAVTMTVTNPDTTTANATFTYTGANLTSIAIAPTNPSIAKGTTQQFTATGTYSDSTTADITSAVTWQSTNGAVATIANTAGNNGIATGVGSGTSTITATLSGVTSNNATLTVTAATLTSIAVTPANPQIAKGTTQQFTATGAFSDGSHQDLTGSTTWSSNTPAVATISNAAGTTGQATGIGSGTTTISATLGGVSGSTSLAVTDATLISIAVTPASPQIAKGTSQQFTATGTFSDGSTQDLTSSATWSATGGTGTATISNSAGTKGQATGTTPGTGIIISAAFGGKTGTATLAVTAATLTSIAITPGGASVPRGMTQQFSATGTFSDSSTQDLTATVTWASTNTGVAANPPNGLATGANVGTTTITANLASVTSPGVTLTVTNATLTGIAVTPANPSIAKGTTQQFTATGAYSDASTANLTSSVQWQSSDPTKATINAGGQATGVATGGTTITATLSGVTSNNATLTVTAATLTSLAVTPANPVIAKGTTQQFTATGTFSDGTTQDLTTDPGLTWQSGTAGVATISSSGATKGQTTAVAPGTAQITATRGGVSGGITLTVTNATLIGIAVTPSPANVPRGATRQFTATGTYSDTTTADLTSSVTWASSAPGVATISNAVGSHGIATAIAPGTTAITATQGGMTSNSATLTVPKTLQSITITPANPSVKVGATAQLTATATYSDNTTQDLTGQAQWSSSDPSVASVDATGKVTGQSPGTVTIKATASGVTGQTQVTVASTSPIGVNPAPAPGPRASGVSVGSGGSPPAPAPTGR